MNMMVFPSLTESDTRLPIYLSSIGHWDNQEEINRPSGYPAYQWLQVVSGVGELIVNNERITLRAGDGFCLFPDETHQYYAIQEPWEIYWVSFGGTICEELFLQAGITGSGAYSIPDHEIIITHMKNIYAMTQSGSSFLGLDCSKLVYMMILDLIKVILLSSRSMEQHYEKLSPVLRYIEEHHSSLITIQQLANCIDVTPQYLCLLFKNTMKMRPMEYVNRTRINYSKQLMFNESGIKLQRIAQLVGFDSPSYYSAVFKRLEGLSPEQFKKIHGIR